MDGGLSNLVWWEMSLLLAGGVGTRQASRSFPTQTMLWFCGSAVALWAPSPGTAPHGLTPCSLPALLSSADGHCHTLPQGDLQQRPDRQLRSGKPDERVAAVAREAPEREVSVATQRSRGCQPAKARRRGFLAPNELSERLAEFREMVNI